MSQVSVHFRAICTAVTMRTIIIDIGWRDEREKIIMHKSKETARATNSTTGVKNRTCSTKFKYENRKRGEHSSRIQCGTINRSLMNVKRTVVMIGTHLENT